MKKKVLLALLAVMLGVFAVAGPASAHVTVNPKTADKGSYAKLTFRVPTEKDNASTTKLEVNIPTDNPITSVSVQPQPGWTYTIEKTTLPTPVKSEDGDITQAVSKITWTADASNAIKPGEFNEFNISAGPLPKNVDSVAFKALQTYSDGEVVRWIETAAPGAPKPEHPAPLLTLTNAAATGDVTGHPDHTTDAVSKSDIDGARGIAIGALVVAIVAVIIGGGAYAVRRPTNK